MLYSLRHNIHCTYELIELENFLYIRYIKPWEGLILHYRMLTCKLFDRLTDNVRKYLTAFNSVDLPTINTSVPRQPPSPLPDPPLPPFAVLARLAYVTTEQLMIGAAKFFKPLPLMFSAYIPAPHTFIPHSTISRSQYVGVISRDAAIRKSYRNLPRVEKPKLQYKNQYSITRFKLLYLLLSISVVICFQVSVLFVDHVT